MAGATLVKGLAKGAKKLVPSLWDEAADVTKAGWKNAINTGKITQEAADEIINTRNIAEFDRLSVEGAQELDTAARNSAIERIGNKNKAVPRRQTFDEWSAGAQEYYDKRWDEGIRHNVMKGYPHFTDVLQENPASLRPDSPGIRSYRATPGDKIKGDPTGKKKVTFVDKQKKGKGIADRTANEKRWVGELEEALKKRNFTEEERTNIITNMKRVNKQQDTKRTLRNEARRRTNPNLPTKDFLTIEHMGALKKGWANIPENREGLITRRANSQAGARNDPNTWAINMTGMPGDPKKPGSWADAYAAKLELAKDFGKNNPDPTVGLPIEIKKKILKAAGKGGRRSRAKVDKILQDYYGDASASIEDLGIIADESTTDQALKNVIERLKKDPTALDSSGFGGRTNISDRD